MSVSKEEISKLRQKFANDFNTLQKKFESIVNVVKLCNESSKNLKDKVAALEERIDKESCNSKTEKDFISKLKLQSDDNSEEMKEIQARIYLLEQERKNRDDSELNVQTAENYGLETECKRKIEEDIIKLLDERKENSKKIENIEHNIECLVKEQEALKNDASENKKVLENCGYQQRPPTPFKNSDSNYNCKSCDLKFHDQKNLKQHIRLKHPKRIVCSLCDLKFHESYNLEEHLIQIHGKKKSFTCNICKFGSVLRWRLTKHMQVHGKLQQRTCHFFNNDKPCPFERVGCKFAHEEAIRCKFGERCNKTMCQYKHI